LDPSTLAVTSEDFLYQPDDRFKPRVGKLYFLRPFLPSDDEEVSLIQKLIAPSNLQPDEVEGDAGWGVEECSSPPPSQAKPNPEIRVAFDQDIPITRRTSEGTTETIGRIIPPPRWEEHTLNRAAAAAGAHFRTASGQLTVQFRSWLVKHDDRRAANGQSRDFTLRAQLVVQIREKLKRVWNDHIGQGDLFQVIVVRPAPFADQNGETFLHIIAEVNRQPRSPLQPVLMAMRELASLSISRPIWCVGLLPDDFDTEDVFDLCLPVCERHQLLIPRGGTTRGWLGPRQSRRAHAGLFIPIWWDERLTEQEAQRLHPGDEEVEESILLQRAVIIHDDSTSLLQVPGPAIHPWPPSPFGKAAEDVASLMQRPAPSSAPNLIPTFVAGLHLPLRTVHIDMDRPVTETVADFWPYETDSSSVVALYPVTDPPVSTRTGPQPMLIAQQSQDRFEQEHPDDVLAVVTVSFQRDLASRERRHRFKVLWVPWRGTRTNYIDYFRMTGHCRMTHIICFLYLNNVIWPETDGAIRSLTNGEHLRLQIRADDNTDWCTFEYTENAARQRRIFESSPEPADDPEEAERSSSSVSEPRSRSRSRNPPDEESDSHSLFQQQPGGRRVLRDITNLAKGSMMLGQPPDKELVGYRMAEDPDVTTLRPPPHVFDRWCGDADVSGTSEFHYLRTPPVPIELAQAVELPPPPERIPIDLASALEQTPPTRQTSNGLDFRPAASLLELLDSHLLLTSFDFTAPLGWHHTSYDWLGYPWWEVDEPLQEVHIYTDGSAREEGTGAAFIAFGLQSGSWRLLGSFSQTLPSHWEAHHAEDLALWYANKFLYDVCRIAHNRGFELPWDLVCHYDSMVAGGKAFGQYTAHTHVACAHATRCMIQLCDTAFNTTIRGLHVKGHNGDPGNEAANTLAEAAACGSPTHPHDPLLASIAAGDFGFEFSWAWALFYPPFGPYWHELQLHLPLSGPRSSSYSGLSAVPHEPSTEEEAGKVCMQIATANVLTLKPKKTHKQASEETACGLGSASSQDAFFKQCHEEGIHLLACQETRLKRGPRCNEWYFFRHSSATDQGCYGITVAFSTQLPIGTFLSTEGIEEPVYWKDKDIAVIAKSPRFLLLRSTNALCRAIFVAAHAPHMGHSEQDIAQWWTDLRKQIPGNYNDWPVLFLGDANAHVGSHTSAAVGDHLSEEEHPKSSHFHDTLLDWDAYLPSTFQDFQKGEAGTWFHHQSKKWKRGDYVAIPRCWPLETCEAEVCDHIDFGHEAMDHRLTKVSFTRLVIAKTTWDSRNRHRQLLRTLDCDWRADPKLLRQHIVTSLSDVWHDDVHRHEARLQHSLQQHLVEFGQSRRTYRIKTHLSDFTWQLVLDKRDCKKRLRLAEASRSTLLLATFFHTWASTVTSIDLPALSRISDAECKKNDHQTAQLQRELQAITRRATAAVRADDRCFYESLAVKAASCDQARDVKGLWKLLKASIPKHKAKRRGDNPLQDVELEGQWEHHFATLEAGQSCDLAGEFARCKDHQSENTWHVSQPSLQDLPTRFEIENVLRATQPNRATGLDPVPSALYKYNAVELAQPVFDLLLKVFWQQKEPFPWKGGAMVPIHKRGCVTRAENYRGIMLLPTLAKRFHALLRSRLVPPLQVMKPLGLIGGLPHQEVGFGSLAIRSFCNIAKERHWPFAVLYIDLKHAFHHLIRELLFGVTDPEGFTEVLRAVTTSGGDQEEVKRLCNEATLRHFGVSPGLQRLLADVHTNTWCTIGEGGPALRTNRGSRPGSPLADIIFHFLMASAQRDLEAILQAKQGYQHILDHLGLPVWPVTWADDIAIPWAARDSTELLQDLHDIVHSAHKTFTMRGLTLNFQKGKTSAVVNLAGPGAPAARRQHVLHAAPGIDVSLCDGTTVFLSFVPIYKHLGVQCASSLGTEFEIRKRIGEARQAFVSMKRRIFLNKRLRVRTRLQLADSLVFSKLYFGLGGIPTVGERLMKQIVAFVSRVYRDILEQPLWGEAPMETEHFFMIHRLTHPRIRIARDRLLFASRLFRSKPTFVHDALSLEHKACKTASWLSSLQDDLDWMRATLQDQWPDNVGCGVEDLTAHWRHGSLSWPTLVRQAHAKHLLQERGMAQVFHWHRQIFDILDKTGFKFSPDPLRDDEGISMGGKVCHCGRVFTTGQGLQLHKAKAHHEYAPEHAFVTGATCTVCKRYFWSFQRLQQHLAYIPRGGRGGAYNRCFAELVRRGGDPTQFARVVLPESSQGWNRRDALPVEGPDWLPPSAAQIEAQVLKQQLDQALLELQTFGLDVAPEDHFQTAFMEELTHQTRTWFDSFDPDTLPHVARGQLQDAWITALDNECHSGGCFDSTARFPPCPGNLGATSPTRHHGRVGRRLCRGVCGQCFCGDTCWLEWISCTPTVSCYGTALLRCGQKERASCDPQTAQAPQELPGSRKHFGEKDGTDSEPLCVTGRLDTRPSPNRVCTTSGVTGYGTTAQNCGRQTSFCCGTPVFRSTQGLGFPRPSSPSFCSH